MIRTEVTHKPSFSSAVQQAPLTPDLITEALKEASAELNHQLNSDDLRFELVGTEGGAVLGDLNNQWESKTYNWNKNVSRALQSMSSSADDDLINNFVVALYKGDKLCGLCRSDERGTDLNVDVIEGLQDKGKNPLFGFTIASFSQALLNIAQKSGMSGLAVATPDFVHTNAYLRAGYNAVKRDSGMIDKFKMAVSESTQINWSAVIKRQEEKNTPPVNENRSISSSSPARQQMPA